MVRRLEAKVLQVVHVKEHGRDLIAEPAERFTHPVQEAAVSDLRCQVLPLDVDPCSGDGHAARGPNAALHQSCRDLPEVGVLPAGEPVGPDQDEEHLGQEAVGGAGGVDPDRVLVDQHTTRRNIGLQSVDEAGLTDAGLALDKGAGGITSTDGAADPCELGLAADEQGLDGNSASGLAFNSSWKNGSRRRP